MNTPRHLLTAAAAAICVVVPAFATDVSGTIDEDAIWSVGGSPYNVTSTVTVASGVELTIQPGVEVLFVDSAGLTVSGVLTAVGTEQNPILFIGGAASGNPVGTGSRIKMDDATGESHVAFAVVSHFNNGFEIFLSCTIEHSIIQQNQEAGILVPSNTVTPEPVVTHNLILHNDLGISMANFATFKRYGGTYEYNTIVRNWSAGIKTRDLYGVSDPITVSHSIVAFNGIGLLCQSQDIHSEFNVLWRNGASAEPTGMPSVGDVFDDPLFVNPINWDFRVLGCSPAMSAGNNGNQVGAFGDEIGLPANPRSYSTTPTTSGTLSRDEVWTGTVSVTDTVIVPPQCALRMEPGTTVTFAGNAGLEIGGVLFALGTAASPILLVGGGTAGPVTGASRIYLNGTPGESTIEHVEIGHFYDGVFTEASCSGGCTIRNNVVHDNQRYGLHLVATVGGAHPLVVNNVIDGNTVGVLLSLTNSNKGIFGTYEFNTIVNSTNEGFYLYDQYGDNTITFRNSIVVGNGLGIGTWGGGVSDMTLLSEYNDSWNNSGGDYFSYFDPTFGPGIGDFSADPLFALPGSGDYSLLPGSPALTASAEGGEIGAFGSFVPAQSLIFCDGFEFGDLSAWAN